MPRLSIGRIVHVYSPARWHGARPGTIVAEPSMGGAHLDLNGKPYCETCDLNVALNGMIDVDALCECRSSPNGNTFPGVPVFEELPEGVQHVEPIFAVMPPRVDGKSMTGTRSVIAPDAT